MYSKVKVITDKKIQNLCKFPYYNHPKGCPNYGKKKDCPPKALFMENVSNEFYAVYNIFDFAEHCEKIKKKHPTWSKRQIECCLYWQPKARKQLNIQIKDFLREVEGDWKIIKNPEAHGVNLTETMKNIGVNLEWPPITKTYQIVLAERNS